MHEWLKEYFERNLALELADFTYGTALTGSKRLFAACASDAFCEA